MCFIYAAFNQGRGVLRYIDSLQNTLAVNNRHAGYSNPKPAYSGINI